MTYFSLLVILAFAAWVALADELGMAVYVAGRVAGHVGQPPSWSPRYDSLTIGPHT